MSNANVQIQALCLPVGLSVVCSVTLRCGPGGDNQLNGTFDEHRNGAKVGGERTSAAASFATAEGDLAGGDQRQESKVHGVVRRHRPPSIDHIVT